MRVCVCSFLPIDIAYSQLSEPKSSCKSSNSRGLESAGSPLLEQGESQATVIKFSVCHFGRACYPNHSQVFWLRGKRSKSSDEKIKDTYVGMDGYMEMYFSTVQDGGYSPS